MLWGAGWQQFRSQQCALAAQRAKHVLGSVKCCDSCSEERIILLHSALMHPHMGAVCTSAPRHLRKMWRSLCTERQQSWWKAWKEVSFESKGLWACLVCRKEAEVTSLPSTASSWGEWASSWGREMLNFFPDKVSSDKMFGNVSKLYHSGFRLDIRKHFFTKSMVRCWNRQSMPKPVSVLRGIWTKPLKHALTWSALGDCCRTLPSEIIDSKSNIWFNNRRYFIASS